MISGLVLIVVLGALVVVGTWLWGKLIGPGPVMEAVPNPQAADQHNDAALAAGNYAALEFDVARHGYRQDQVDRVIAALSAELERYRAATPDLNKG